MSSDVIPVIDLSLGRRSRGTMDDVAGAVRVACEEIGFFCIAGHGLSESVVDAVYRSSRDFFDLDPGEKSRVGKSGEAVGGLTFFPMMTEALAASRGDLTPGDLKESLNYGPHFYGAPWPTHLPELRRAWLAYFAAMNVLAGRLRRVFSVAIGRPADHFEPMFDRHHSALRVLSYPVLQAPPRAGQLRAGAHTDYDFITILRSEDAPGGLQAQTRAGVWIDVPVVPGAFVVNVGDLLMRWTNDRWVSTVHRVVNPADAHIGESRRQSIAFFHSPNRDAVIDCLPEFRDPGGLARYEPITCGAYAELKYQLANGEALRT